jgi:hypothetical protein
VLVHYYTYSIQYIFSFTMVTFLLSKDYFYPTPTLYVDDDGIGCAPNGAGASVRYSSNRPSMDQLCVCHKRVSFT